MASPQLSRAPVEEDVPNRLRLEAVPESVLDEVEHSGTLFRGPFLRLWLAQVTSSLGDWVGLVAILALAARLGGGASSGTAVGIVMVARMAPGFFLASVGGVLVDRWDRKKVMVLCDVGRAGVMATLPWIGHLWGLVAASLLLEVMTLLWSPAKEASVPNLVSTDKLAAANSLSLVAAYGTFPVAAGLTAVLFKVNEWLGHFPALDWLQLNTESIAIYFDVFTFLVSAALIATLALGKAERSDPGPINLRATFEELADGWRYIGSSPVVRAVMLGLATGLFGGGMVVPLGIDFSTQVLEAGQAGFSLLLTALGMGVAAGVLLLSAAQRRLPRERIFVLSAFGGGAFLLLGATASTLTLAMICVGLLGVCAGSVYVVGFTILHENVRDELRGRIFATLYTLIRLCLLAALALAPFLSELLDRVSRSVNGPDRTISVAGLAIGLPGVRLTLWFGALVVLVAGCLAAWSLRRPPSTTMD